MWTAMDLRSSVPRHQLVALAVAVTIQLTCASALARFSEETYACGPAYRDFPFCSKALSVESRVSDLLSQLSLEEKIGQLVSNAANISRLGIPPYVWCSEALHGIANGSDGVRFGYDIPAATMFPQVILSTASFNRTLWNLIAQAVSTEARAMYNVGQAGLTFWSPNINIFRDPRWGRGQETPGEDPFVSSEYAVAYVSGLQGQEYSEESRDRTILHEKKSGQNPLKVAACCKHFTAYDLEAWGGYTRLTFDALVTVQDLADTYNPPFRSCVQEGQATCVMCSYNRLNGVPTCADSHLLSELLRQEWGLKGYVTSDCDAVSVLYKYSGYAASEEEAVADCLNAGMDLNCGTFVSKHAAEALQQGAINISTIDKALANLFTVRMQLGLFDGNPKNQPFGRIGPEAVCANSHRKLALEAAKQGLVLLKNEARNLPFLVKQIKRLAVIGPNANASGDMLLGDFAGPPCDAVTPLEGLQSFVDVDYAPGCINVSCDSDFLVKAATEVASVADAIIIFAGLDKSQEGENQDRTELLLPGQQQPLISEVANIAHGPVVLVILSGGPVDVTFAKGNPKIQSIVWAGYPGEAGGRAIAELVFGKFSPGGRLPMTWYPEGFTQVPMTDMNMRPNPSRGYPGRTHRFYRGDVVFKFGYGLTYMDISESFASAPPEIYLPTCMDLSSNNDLLQMNTLPSVCHVPDEIFNSDLDDGAWFNVTVRLCNHGSIGGSYSVLLFSKQELDDISFPQQQLIGFKRVHLNPNGADEVSFSLNPYKHLTVVNEYGKRVLNVGPHVLVVNDQIEHTILVKFPGAKAKLP